MACGDCRNFIRTGVPIVGFLLQYGFGNSSLGQVPRSQQLPLLVEACLPLHFLEARRLGIAIAQVAARRLEMVRMFWAYQQGQDVPHFLIHDSSTD